jgi:hypothetical protein
MKEDASTLLIDFIVINKDLTNQGCLVIIVVAAIKLSGFNLITITTALSSVKMIRLRDSPGSIAITTSMLENIMHFEGIIDNR